MLIKIEEIWGKIAFSHPHICSSAEEFLQFLSFDQFCFQKFLCQFVECFFLLRQKFFNLCVSTFDDRPNFAIDLSSNLLAIRFGFRNLRAMSSRSDSAWTWTTWRIRPCLQRPLTASSFDAAWCRERSNSLWACITTLSLRDKMSPRTPQWDYAWEIMEKETMR